MFLFNIYVVIVVAVVKMQRYQGFLDIITQQIINWMLLLFCVTVTLKHMNHPWVKCFQTSSVQAHFFLGILLHHHQSAVWQKSASIISISVVNIKLLISFHAQSSIVKLHAESVLLQLFGHVFLKDYLVFQLTALIMATYLIASL